MYKYGEGKLHKTSCFEICMTIIMNSSCKKSVSADADSQLSWVIQDTHRYSPNARFHLWVTKSFWIKWLLSFSGIQPPPPPKKKKKKKKIEVYSMFFWQPFCSSSIRGREWGWLHLFLEPKKHCVLYIFWDYV